MKAETAYNVIQALPEGEKNRLFLMLGLTNKPVQKKENDSKFLTVSQCTEMLLKQLNDRKAKRNNKTLKMV